MLQCARACDMTSACVCQVHVHVQRNMLKRLVWASWVREWYTMRITEQVAYLCRCNLSCIGLKRQTACNATDR